jgi:hypothetical protein
MKPSADRHTGAEGLLLLLLLLGGDDGRRHFAEPSLPAEPKPPRLLHDAEGPT